MQPAVSARVAAVLRRPAMVEALPALDPYALQFGLCAAAGAVGALTLKLAVKGELSWRPVLRAVLSGAVLAAFATPAISERWHVASWAYLALTALVLGVSAQALVPLIPILTASLAKRAARGWAAAVLEQTPEPPPYEPTPKSKPAPDGAPDKGG